MRKIPPLTIGLVLSFAGLWTWASDSPDDSDAAMARQETPFREVIRPFLDAHCLSCHGHEKPKGDLDLSGFTTAESVAKDLPRWELVLEQLDAQSMPPPKAKSHPSAEARRQVMDWIVATRKVEARRHAGDPGPVAARRLSNAEYDNTIRDLTGFDLRPTKEFPVDPANEAGFDNSAESLSMSPALVKKYLEAARLVSEHLVFRPQGLAFAPHRMVADTDRDKYCVRRVIDFYKTQKTDYADFFLAAWRYRHREKLGKPGATLTQIAAEAGLSAKYTETIWAVLAESAGDVGPIAALQSMWRDLPGPIDARAAEPRAACESMRDFVVELRRRLTPEVKNLKAPGINDGSQCFVLWKDRQWVANRRRYGGNAGSIKPESLKRGAESARKLALPADAAELARYEPSLTRFCAVFPDTFVVTERARVYLDPKQEKGNAGRLLSAGFHSMTGYFRDDGPLCELILDDRGRAELDGLWREFQFITGAPMRQYASFLWFERTDSTFMRGAEFDFARAEDKDAASEAKIRQLAEVYADKARRRNANAEALGAIKEYFEIVSAEIRQVEKEKQESEASHVAALLDFARKAYRRPLLADESDNLAAFYRSLREKDGLSHEDAVRDVLVGILLSPHFCYRVDLPGDGGTGVRPLSDYDLASRLSYFLWSSLPDEELLARAAAGDLHRPEVLVAQARRMLKDGRVRGLATEFGGNWLDFRRFEEHNSVDRGRFPAFNDELRRSMFEEPVRYFLNIVREDRPIREFLDGTHTFVNASLARHYGMPVPAGGPEDWVRVEDARPFGRGGLLPMAVFLTKNSPGLRTSPVKRGYWVVRRLLGEKIPAPPPNVPDLPSDEAKLGELTLRETLARHRADKACAGCHERFDAIGLAYEGYGPVGEFREQDLSGHPVDTVATFPGGEPGKGLDGLKTYIEKHRQEDFVDNLCRKLLAFGLGRGLIAPDDEVIASMKAGLEADGGRFGVLIDRIVLSPQFRNKRVDAQPAE